MHFEMLRHFKVKLSDCKQLKASEISRLEINFSIIPISVCFSGVISEESQDWNVLETVFNLERLKRTSPVGLRIKTSASCLRIFLIKFLGNLVVLQHYKIFLHSPTKWGRDNMFFIMLW
jgi:hypothetical protein